MDQTKREIILYSDAGNANMEGGKAELWKAHVTHIQTGRLSQRSVFSSFRPQKGRGCGLVRRSPA